jgi:hypothetical protein
MFILKQLLVGIKLSLKAVIIVLKCLQFHFELGIFVYHYALDNYHHKLLVWYVLCMSNFVK